MNPTSSPEVSRFIEHDNVGQLKELLAAGLSPNAHLRTHPIVAEGYRLLEYAVQMDARESAALLIKAGKNQLRSTQALERRGHRQSLGIGHAIAR